MLNDDNGGSAEEPVRSFIAIELPDELKLELVVLVRRLREDCPSVMRWVEPANTHLTLKFLGDVAVDRLEAVQAALDAACAETAPFQLEFSGLGVFPEEERVRTVWVDVRDESGQMATLQTAIEQAMAELGFPVESRPFTPHLTLGRVRDRARPEEREAIGQVVAAGEFQASAPVDVKVIHLMKSRLTRGGAIYGRTGFVRLGGG